MNNNLFQELADRFKTGTVNISVQMDKGTMAVMVNFKGIDGIAPRILRGTPAEIDENFIDNLEGVLIKVSDFNANMEDLEKVILEKLEAKKKQAEEKVEAKVKVETKKADIAKGKAAQTSLLDIPAGQTDKEIHDELSEEKEDAFEDDDLISAPVPPVKPAEKPVQKTKTVIGTKKSLTAEQRKAILDALEANDVEPWDVHPTGVRWVVDTLKVNAVEAEIIFAESGIAVEFNKPKPDIHKKNVEAMKEAMVATAPVLEVEEEFVFDDDDDFSL